jgi:hypothetical protein
MTDDELDKRIAALNEICEKMKQDYNVMDNSSSINDDSLIDTSMIAPLTSSQISTITLGGGGAGGGGSMWTSTGPGSTYISPGIGYTNSPVTTTMPNTTLGSAGTYYTSGPTGPVWTGTTMGNQANVRITGKNPTIITDKSEINIDEVAELIKVLKERLLILVPNFEKHEKYQALKKAYDHYKMIEGLIQEEKIDVPK